MVDIHELPFRTVNIAADALDKAGEVGRAAGAVEHFHAFGDGAEQLGFQALVIVVDILVKFERIDVEKALAVLAFAREDVVV